jgi:hypothetical protein
MNNIRHEINRSRNRGISESGSDDCFIHKTDHIAPTIEKNQRKSTMLLAGPKFRYHITESEYNLKRDTIYPISVCISNPNIASDFFFLH